MNRLVAVAFLLSLAVAAFAQDAKALAARNLEAERQATLRKDVAWFDKIQSPDYYEIDIKGMKRNKAQALQSMRVTFKALTIKSVAAKVDSIQKVGEKTLVMVEVRVVGSVLQKGKRYTIDVESSIIEAWSQVGGRWQMLSQKTTGEKTKVNGKLVFAG